MFAYRSYGLSLASELELPELFEASADRFDVTIRLGAVVRPEALLSPDDGFHAVLGEAWLFLGEVGNFHVLAGREIIVEPTASAARELLRIVLLGSIMAILLQQRGRLVLHAAAVARNGAVIGCLGASGSGKSTLAAALLVRGHELVTDDVLALAADRQPPRVFPSYAQLKLSDAALDYIEESPADLPLVPPHFDKRFRRARGLPAEPLHLAHLYVLEVGPLAVTQLAPQQAFVELVRHTYAAHLDFLQPAGLAGSHFTQCAAIAGTTPVSRLTRPLDFAMMNDVVHAISV